MCSRSLTPLRARLAAARTTSAPYQRRIRVHGPNRLGAVRTGSALPHTPLARASSLRCTTCIAAARTTSAPRLHCNRDLGQDRLGMVQALGRVDPARKLLGRAH